MGTKVFMPAVKDLSLIHISFYSMVQVEDIPEIVSEHLLKGRVVSRLLYKETVTDDGIKSLSDTDFYKKQHRIALRNCGVDVYKRQTKYDGKYEYKQRRQNESAH